MIVHPDSPARIYLLGSFEVESGSFILHAQDWPRKKAASLLKRLAIETRLLKEQAVEFLWPETDGDAGANNLYRLIHALRQILNTALGPTAAEAVFSFRDGVLNLLPSVWVDVREFEQLAVKLPGQAPEQRVAKLEEMLRLYRGDLLPDDRYAEWTLLPRAALYRLQHDVRLELAIYYRGVRNYAKAIGLLPPLLTNDPADEPIHRELMQVYALTGQRHEALRQYQACVEALAAELEVSPSPETTALYSQILRGELAQPAIPIMPDIPDLPLQTDKPRPLFVGRELELTLLQSHLQDARAGRGRVLFITGEAGQGKTSLLAEFAHRAQQEYPELIVAAAGCQAMGGISDPYLPFVDLIAMLSGDWQRPWLRGEITIAHIQRLQAIAPKTIQTLTTFAPDLANIIAPALVPAQPHPSRDINQQLLFQQMRRLIHELAADQPVVIILDDLQWIDSASANLLFYLARQLANSRVLIIGAYRPSEVSYDHDSPHPLVPLVQELIRYQGDIRIDLGAIAPAEKRIFVNALLDSEPNQLDATFREELFRHTDGNPLFTVELLRELQQRSEMIRNATGRWMARPNLDWEILPARVEAVIARRIDRLSPELRQVLAVASVEGEIFSAEVIAQVLGTTIRPLLNQLSQELGHHHKLVYEQGEAYLGMQPIARYQFSHNLFQQYFYHQLGVAERRYLHGEIAEVLERLGGEDLDRLAVTLAHHYLEAGDPVRAVPYLCRAGDDARRRAALAEAVQFYRSALTHWQESKPLAQAEVLHMLGQSLLTLGRHQEAIDCFIDAKRLYEQVNNRLGMGAMHRLIGRLYSERGNRSESMHHYQEALAILEQEPESVELARTLSAISQMHMLINEHDQTILWGERALALAQRLQAEDVVVHALNNVGTSLVIKGEERGLAMLAESHERAEALGLLHDICRAYNNWGSSLLDLERFDEAREIFERMLTYTHKVGAEMWEGIAFVSLGSLDWWTGRWKAALARQQKFLFWMETSDAPTRAKIWASNLLGQMHNDLGLPDRARTALNEYTSAARSASEPQTTIPHLGQLARAAQSEEEKVGLIQEILALLDATTYVRFMTLSAISLVCDWLVQASDGDLSALTMLEKAHEQMQNRQSAARLHEARALAAGLRGDWIQAVADYEFAAANWEALQRPYDVLRTLVGWLEALAHTNTTAVQVVHQRAASLIEQLASELVDQELKQAFLTSPLVREIQTH